jgi:SAM-dependent methyltransferase
VQLADERAESRPSNEALAEKYDAIAYAAQSNPLTHPDHMAVVATLFGCEPAPAASCRVLEVGCNNGANLLPLAADLPDARFVGCDLSPSAIAAARTAVAELGLANVTLFEGDLSALPEALGEFDYMIAHGVYSWVAPSVRDAMLALAGRRLKRNGVLFVSYNVYPGGYVRRAAWEALHFRVDRIADPRARLRAAREFAAALAEPGITQHATDALLRNEFQRIAQTSDSTLYHDDLAEPNDPVYFHQFVTHAARHGLEFLAEADLGLNAVMVSPPMHALMAGRDRLEREQLVDFAHLRRFRQTLLCRAGQAAELALAPERLAPMLLGASALLTRAAAEGKTLVDPQQPGTPAADDAKALQASLEWLIAIAPEAASVSAIAARLGRPTGGGALRPLESILFEACVRGLLAPSLHPRGGVAVAGERPTAGSYARWQARHGVAVTNLRHETMQLRDASALRLLALLDGSRTRAQLAAEMAYALPGWAPAVIAQRIDEFLTQFGRLALLVS